MAVELAPAVGIEERQTCTESTFSPARCTVSPLVRKDGNMKRRKGEGGLIKMDGCRFWYAQYIRDGKRFRVSTRTEVRREALVILRRLMGDSERGLPALGDARKIHYSDLRAGLLESY